MSDDPLDILLDNAEARIRAVQVTEILTDLISELREQRDIWLEGGMDPADDAAFRVVALQVGALTDRAEARLKEVQGE